MFGRKRLLARVLRALETPGAVVHLYGAPGVGKTYLAEAAARELGAAKPTRVVEDEKARNRPERNPDGAERLIFVSRRRPRHVRAPALRVAELGAITSVTLLRRRLPHLEDRGLCLSAIAYAAEGNPFVLEMAARTADLFGLDVTLVRLLESPPRLASADADDAASDPRHASLTALYDDVWNQLSSMEQRALSVAALFPFSFLAEDYARLATDLGVDDPLLRFGALHRASLVFAVTAGAHAVRFMLASPFARYLRARVAGDPAFAGEVERRLVATAEADARLTYGFLGNEALDRLDKRKAELLALFDRADAGPELRIRAWLSLFDALLFRRALPLGDARFADAVRVSDLAEQPLLRAQARILAARAELEVGTADRSLALADEARSIAEAAGLTASVAEAERARGWASLGNGQIDEARRAFETSLAVDRRLGHLRGEADALAALGLITALTGKPTAAEPLFGLSLAIHDRAGDEIRRKKVSDMAELVGAMAATDRPDVSASEQMDNELQLRALLATAVDHGARGERWREALALGQWAVAAEASGRHDGAEAARARARSLAAEAKVTVPAIAIAAREGAKKAAHYTVGPESRWLECPDGQKHDLTRHGSLRRALDALVTARLERPGGAIGAADLLAAGWPGERMRHDAGMLRVYTTVRRLRNLGLGALLLTRDEGYLLDPERDVRRAS